MEFIFKKFLKIQNDEEDKNKQKKIMTYANQDRYEGYINKNGLRHGQGQMFYSNGDKFEGEWYNNLRQGSGKQCYYNGDYYTGQWNKDKKEGVGKYFYSNNERYEGEWYNDYRHGQGSHFFRNGDVYIGQWVKGKKEGRGKITYYNNEEYDGEWLNDKKHIKATSQNNENGAKEHHKTRKKGEDKRDDDRSQSHTDEEKKNELVRKKESPQFQQRKESSPQTKLNNQQNESHDDQQPSSSIKIEQENQTIIDSNNQITSNYLDNKNAYTNQYHSNRDNDFAIATNVESNHYLKSNQIATEVVDTNDIYRTTGQSLQISIDDSKAIDILETMESYEILNNFPQDLREWNTGHICKWLKSIGLGEYIPSFESNQICGQSICMLTEQELEQSIGIKALGKRKIFLKYQEMLKKYYNKKLSKEAKFLIQSSKRLRKGDRQGSYTQNQTNYRSIREEDESVSSHKSLNSNPMNHMDNFMLLEEEDEDDQYKRKKQKDKDKDKNSNSSQDEQESDDNNSNDNRKQQKKQKKKKRDQGGNESHQSSDQESNNKHQQQRSRRNSHSPVQSHDEEQQQNNKEKQKGKKNNSPTSSDEQKKKLQKGFKDTMRDFADDEDEEMHQLLKFQKSKSTQDQRPLQNNISKTSDQTSNKLKQQLKNNFHEEKYYTDIKGDKNRQNQQLFEQKNNQKNDSANTSPQLHQNNGHQNEFNWKNQENASFPNLFQQHNIEEDQNVKPIKEQKETQSLCSSLRNRKKSDKLFTKDVIFNSNGSTETAEQKMHKSDDYGSTHYINSPEHKPNSDLRSLQPDFLQSKPFILNFNSTVCQPETQSTLYKLGIQKDMCLDKVDSQRTGLTKNSSGIQTFNQSSNGVANPTTQNSSIDNNQGQSKQNQNSNNVPSINQINSSTSSSDESSENEQSKPCPHKRSKGDGGASVSSIDSDNNSKIKQRQTPQQKFKKELSGKDSSRNPSKDKEKVTTPKIKRKQKKKEVGKEQQKVRREEREQQLDQLLRDMGINKKLIINYQEIEFGPRIGEGSYGQVFKGVWQKTQVAIKQFGKQNSKFHLRKVQDFISEVRVINNLRHPNIVLYMGVCLYQSQYYMITEHLKEGSLFDHLHEKQTIFTEAKQIDMIEDMGLGMVYLHGRKVMHCDLKSSNVLIDENWNVKLCDFGLSRIKSTLNKKKDERKAEGLVGTPQWMAPEIMRREQYQEHSDVYSFGMIMWEIATRSIPYKGLSHSQIYGTVGYDDNYEVEIPKRGIPRYLNLMKKCLKRNPAERPTFQEIVEEIQLIKKDLKDNNKKQVVKEIIRFFG